MDHHKVSNQNQNRICLYDRWIKVEIDIRLSCERKIRHDLMNRKKKGTDFDIITRFNRFSNEFFFSKPVSLDDDVKNVMSNKKVNDQHLYHTITHGYFFILFGST